MQHFSGYIIIYNFAIMGICIMEFQLFLN